MKLGLLFGEDTEATTEELPAVLSFQHKLLQEYLAAIYIVENVRLDTTSTFLAKSFPTWGKIETHREVVQFAGGILASIDTSLVCITDHVAKTQILNEHNKLNNGKDLAKDFSILFSCQREEGLPAFNPYLSEYPTCGHPLAEVLAKTELVYITGIDENDKLELNQSPAQIIVKLESIDEEKYDRLWQELHDISANVIALSLSGVRSANVAKLSQFPQLKYLHLGDCDLSEEEGGDLAESIEAWGSNPQLTFCAFWGVPIPRSLMTGLSKCSHLVHLDLIRYDLHDKLDAFMSTPPPALRDLTLFQCSLHASDIDHITQAILQGGFKHLELLGIHENPIGEAAVGHLLAALVSIRPKTQLELWLYVTGVDGNGEHTDLSKQFITQWKAKLTGTNINVSWEY